MASALGAAVVFVHTGGAPATPGELLHHWTTAPSVLVPLAATALLYGRGVAVLGRRLGAGRGLARWRVGAFWAGMAALAIALVSPLDAAGEVLFSAHMVQHLVLVLAAAPLLVMGAPERAIPWALPLAWRRVLGQAIRRVQRMGGVFARPGPAVVIASAALWAWHLPALYDLAVEVEAIHALEHATFFGTATLFWWSVLHVRTLRADGANGGRLLSVVAMVFQGSLLGALITFAARPLYASHEAIPPAWGLSPLEDQQLAGLLMWVPPAALYLSVAAYLFLRWLEAAKTAEARYDRRVAAPTADEWPGSTP